jgi:hypothetical protein
MLIGQVPAEVCNLSRTLPLVVPALMLSMTGLPTSASVEGWPCIAPGIALTRTRWETAA